MHAFPSPNCNFDFSYNQQLQDFLKSFHLMLFSLDEREVKFENRCATEATDEKDTREILRVINTENFKFSP